jgi:hypothetical protein
MGSGGALDRNILFDAIVDNAFAGDAIALS